MKEQLVIYDEKMKKKEKLKQLEERNNEKENRLVEQLTKKLESQMVL